jgi:hypothetical protein
MERYKAGAIAEAIAFWEPIYREMGHTKGYRLAYNLGVAYQEFGDATHAADRLEAFLAEVEARRTRNESIEAIVAKEETDARSRLAGLVATKGRLRIVPGNPPVAVQVDAMDPRIAGFVAYVAPGSHKVTFAPGTKDASSRDVSVGAGEIVDVQPPAPPEVVPEPPPQPIIIEAPKPPPVRIIHEVRHPIPIATLYVGGGLTLASIALPILTYTHAANLRTSYRNSTDPGERANIQNDYGSAQTLGNVTMAVPFILAGATGALTAWYYLGKTERDIVIPMFAPGQQGAVVGVSGKF